MSKRKSTKVEYVCERCGKHFLVDVWRARKNVVKYCSFQCYKGTEESNFWRNVRKASDDSCWLWLGHFRRKYGSLMVNYVAKGAHRISWEIHYGPIPEGMLVCHKCDNPPCVRPDHLFLGTGKDNTNDMIKKGRSAKQYGEFNPMAKLNREKVLMIHSLKADNRLTLRQISEIVGVGVPSVCQVLSGKRWKRIYSELHSHADDIKSIST